jgi:general stress protein 26
MLETKAKPDRADVTRLLAGAAKTMRSARNCWLATAAEAGGVNLRPMGQTQRHDDEDEWTIRFITDGRSHKAADIRRAGEVKLIFQHDPDLAFATLIGRATLRENASEDRKHWKSTYDVYFHGEQDRTHAAFIEVEAERMELWIRGVTPEPFGLRATVLERDVEGWRLIG